MFVLAAFSCHQAQHILPCRCALASVPVTVTAAPPRPSAGPDRSRTWPPGILAVLQARPGPCARSEVHAQFLGAHGRSASCPATATSASLAEQVDPLLQVIAAIGALVARLPHARACGSPAEQGPPGPPPLALTVFDSSPSAERCRQRSAPVAFRLRGTPAVAGSRTRSPGRLRIQVLGVPARRANVDVAPAQVRRGSRTAPGSRCGAAPPPCSSVAGLLAGQQILTVDFSAFDAVSARGSVVRCWCDEQTRSIPVRLRFDDAGPVQHAGTWQQRPRTPGSSVPPRSGRCTSTTCVAIAVRWPGSLVASSNEPWRSAARNGCSSITWRRCPCGAVVHRPRPRAPCPGRQRRLPPGVPVPRVLCDGLVITSATRSRWIMPRGVGGGHFLVRLPAGWTGTRMPFTGYTRAPAATGTVADMQVQPNSSAVQCLAEHGGLAQRRPRLRRRRSHGSPQCARS